MQTFLRFPDFSCPLKKPIRATAAKEVGMGNPAEKRLSTRIKIQICQQIQLKTTTRMPRHRNGTLIRLHTLPAPGP